MALVLTIDVEIEETFITIPIRVFLPKGTVTLVPFLILLIDLYVKHCLTGISTATS